MNGSFKAIANGNVSLPSAKTASSYARPKRTIMPRSMRTPHMRSICWGSWQVCRAVAGRRHNGTAHRPHDAMDARGCRDAAVLIDGTAPVTGSRRSGVTNVATGQNRPNNYDESFPVMARLQRPLAACRPLAPSDRELHAVCTACGNRRSVFQERTIMNALAYESTRNRRTRRPRAGRPGWRSRRLWPTVRPVRADGLQHRPGAARATTPKRRSCARKCSCTPWKKSISSASPNASAAGCGRWRSAWPSIGPCAGKPLVVGRSRHAGRLRGRTAHAVGSRAGQRAAAARPRRPEAAQDAWTAKPWWRST